MLLEGTCIVAPHLSQSFHASAMRSTMPGISTSPRPVVLSQLTTLPWKRSVRLRFAGGSGSCGFGGTSGVGQGRSQQHVQKRVPSVAGSKRKLYLYVMHLKYRKAGKTFHALTNAIYYLLLHAPCKVSEGTLHTRCAIAVPAGRSRSATTWGQQRLYTTGQHSLRNKSFLGGGV